MVQTVQAQLGQPRALQGNLNRETPTRKGFYNVGRTEDKLMDTTVLTGEGLALRLETIAINAIIAAQMAKGRAQMPWIDDDTHRKSVIASYLNLASTEQIPTEAYHYQVVSQKQAPKNPDVEAAERMLADVLNAADAEPAIKTTIKKAA